LSQNISKEDFEIIIVDDNSNDFSKKILKKYDKYKNIKIIYNKKNLGVAGAANIGLKNSKGKYVVRVDADDYVTKNFLNFLIQYLDENKEVFCVSCDYFLVDNDENKIKKVSAESSPISCGIMYRKDKLIDLGMYNAKFRHREEEELRNRIGKNYLRQNLPMGLYRYRMHNSNKTKKKEYKKLWKSKIKNILLNKNLKFNASQKAQLNYCIAIIPAKGNSSRLKNKNIRDIWGKPMIYWSIMECKKSLFIKDVYVTSESKKLLKLAKKYGAKTILRSAKLSKPNVYKIEPVRDAINQIKEKNKIKIVSIVQANSPNISYTDIDNSLIKMIKFKLNEVMSVDSNLNQNAAIRTLKVSSIFQNSLSVHFGVIKTNIYDIHTLKDLKFVEKNYLKQ